MFYLSRNKKPVAVVLGGTFPHAELLRRLRAMGYYTVLIDYYDNPPAAQFADEHSTESAMDYDAVLRIAKEKHASLIMSCCLDQQLNIAMRVSEELGLPHPFSSETALKATNKTFMKQIFLENGIPTSRFHKFGKTAEISQIDLNYPVMVKPADACGSASVVKISKPEMLKNAVNKACEMSRTGEAIVEEYMPGIEVAAYTYISNGKASVVSISQRYSYINDKSTICYAVTNPAFISEKARENIETIANKIAEAYRLNNTPMFFQARVNGDEVRVIEFSPRIGGGTGYHIIELSSGFDIMSASIESYFGREYHGKITENDKFLIMQQVFVNPGIFDHFEGVDELISEGLIDELCMLTTPGSRITDEKVSSSKIAVVYVIGRQNNVDECLERLEKAWGRLHAVDQNGNDMIKHDLFLSADCYYEKQL